MSDVVICAVARTPVGRYRGALADRSAVELGVHAVKGLLSRVGIDPASGIIDEVLFGQVLQAGAGQAPARQVALGAGMPHSTPATTINKVCGSSLKAVMLAANSIRAGSCGLLSTDEILATLTVVRGGLARSPLCDRMSTALLAEVRPRGVRLTAKTLVSVAHSLGNLNRMLIPWELKHLSTARKRNQTRCRL